MNSWNLNIAKTNTFTHKHTSFFYKNEKKKHKLILGVKKTPKRKNTTQFHKTNNTKT